jgi:hypothetical protein
MKEKRITMKKGVAYSTIAILALLGILMVSIWSYSQLATGSRFGLTLTQREPQDIALSNLELAKQFLTQNLKFSSQTAALDIAANGGTQSGATYWYCDSQPTPPETNEVNYAMSNTILNFTNAYIATIPNSQLERLGVHVSNYNCAGVYDNGHDLCTQQDSSQCEGFQTTGTQGGTIQITSPAQVQYTGSLAADDSPNRFYWMYYKLYDDTKASGLLRSIAAGLRDTCPTQTMDAASRLQIALQKACDHYENLLAEPDGTKYVQCKMEVLCADTQNPGSCINTPCHRPALTQQLCWTSASQSSASNQNQGKIASAQGAAFAGIRVKVTLTDTKFNIPSSEGLQPLVWNLWAETQISNQECRPINGGTTV